MKKIIVITMHAFCIFAATAAFALQQKPPQEKPEEIQVGERAKTHVEQVSDKEARLEVPEEEMVKEEQKAQDALLSSIKEREQVAFVNPSDARFEAPKLPKSVVYYTTHQGVYSYPDVVSFNGDTVYLSNGTTWMVCSFDSYKTLNWLTSDSIIVMPNPDSFSIYDYCLVNLNTGAHVQVNLFSATKLYQITRIDRVSDIVYLNDGSSWGVSIFDSSLLYNWYAGDAVILGINNDPLSIRPNILINPHTLNYVCTTCLN